MRQINGIDRFSAAGSVQMTLIVFSGVFSDTVLTIYAATGALFANPPISGEFLQQVLST
jgi:hypothetical protein